MARLTVLAVAAVGSLCATTALAYPGAKCADLRKEYDYVIVGGGAAGLTVANRLSENPGMSLVLALSLHSQCSLNYLSAVTVLVIEAGDL